MSRIGTKPVSVPKNIKVLVAKTAVSVEGPKGKLQFALSPRITVTQEADKVKVGRVGNARTDRALHGLTRAMIANMIRGVTDGYLKELELVGVGYRAQMTGRKVTFQLGYSHPIEFLIPEGITIEVPKPTNIIVKGIDRQKVGQVAANIQRLSPPEPYKGKGIRFVGEQVRRKAGKATAAK